MDLDKLVEKASIWQSLFDECPFAIAVVDNDMKFFMVNQAFEALTDFHQTEVLGEKIQLVLPERFRKSHKRHEKTFALKPEKKVNRHGLEPYILTKNNEELPVDIDLSYIIYNSRTFYVAFIRRII